MINAVIFDMDGVLIDSENHWQQTERELFRELGIELTDELLLQTRGLRTEEMVHHWTSIYGLNSVSGEELMNRYDSRMVETMRTKVPLMKGAVEAVSFFKDKGLPIALATCSTHEIIDAAMEKHGLLKRFNLVVSAAHQMPGKPHPEVYLRTAGQLGVDPVFCLAVEDSFFGVISARAARMKVLAMPDPKEYEQERFSAADMKIRSLTEINDDLYEKLQKI